MLEADIVGIGKWLNSRRLSGYLIDFFFFFSYIRNSCYRANDGIPLAPFAKGEGVIGRMGLRPHPGPLLEEREVDSSGETLLTPSDLRFQRKK